jgi:hypothetical protein
MTIQKIGFTEVPKILRESLFRRVASTSAQNDHVTPWSRRRFHLIDHGDYDVITILLLSILHPNGLFEGRLGN